MSATAQQSEARPAERAALGHVLPFVVWLLLMQLPGLPPAWNYALRTVTGLALLAWLRPWRWYPAPRAAAVPAALLVGAAVFGCWVFFELGWVGARWPALQAAYQRYAVGFGSFGKAPAPQSSPYAPAACGWALALTRLAGSAFIIAVVEEFFWRGFLYRFLAGKSFPNVAPSAFHVGAFLAVTVLFGIEHSRWLAGLVAGAAYGVLYIRTRDIWAAVLAHVTTNLLLGVYVIGSGAYRFW